MLGGYEADSGVAFRGKSAVVEIPLTSHGSRSTLCEVLGQPLFIYLFIFNCTGVWIQGLAFAKQVLSHSNYSTFL
jgi:hypothetical protein